MKYFAPYANKDAECRYVVLASSQRPFKYLKTVIIPSLSLHFFTLLLPPSLRLLTYAKFSRSLIIFWTCVGWQLHP